MQLDDIVNEIITAAFNEAQMSNHEYFTPEHILYASLLFEEGIEIIENSGGNVKRLKNQINKIFKGKYRDCRRYRANTNHWNTNNFIELLQIMLCYLAKN